MKLFLASASPRRKEIMEMLPFEFEVFVPKFDERKYEEELIKSGISGEIEITTQLAKGKAIAAYKQLKERFPMEDIAVLSADTIVTLDGEIFGKGENRQKAIDMLTQLSGRTHEVISAVWILGDVEEKHITEVSKVSFADLEPSLIEYYVEHYKPFDKAGSYGIQDAGAVFVEKIEGSYHNIMGLPIRGVYEILKGGVLKASCSK